MTAPARPASRGAADRGVGAAWLARSVLCAPARLRAADPGQCARGGRAVRPLPAPPRPVRSADPGWTRGRGAGAAVRRPPCRADANGSPVRQVLTGTGGARPEPARGSRR